MTYDESRGLEIGDRVVHLIDGVGGTVTTAGRGCPVVGIMWDDFEEERIYPHSKLTHVEPLCKLAYGGMLGATA